ncbi:MAG TPA: biopolymer transporter ExbD [Saprospiraceae bacterium]|nr:biopolymer transporter ExbD [Saprospiraceae bacterium]HHH52895.1 biopolymer transporter ExbD [Bacteroidota bacterium]
MKIIKFNKKERSGYSSEGSGSMADIAFLLLIFFLVATTIFNEVGIKSTLPEWKPTATLKPKHVDNVSTIFINSQNKILFEGKEVESQRFDMVFADYVKRLLTKSKNVELTVSLGYDRSTTYGVYLRVLDSIKKIYTDAYDKLALTQFNRRFDKCSVEEKREIYNHLNLDIWEMPPSDLLSEK